MCAINLGVKVRTIELNVNQRCSGTDGIRRLISRKPPWPVLPVKAVPRRSRTKKMISLLKRDSDVPYTMHCAAEDVSLICNQEKNSRRNGSPQQETITDDFLAYALLLIQGEPKRDGKRRAEISVPEIVLQHHSSLLIKKFV
ncbi:MAG: hypothetical protein ACLUAR_16995 [Pilosibacter sp.]